MRDRLPNKIIEQNLLPLSLFIEIPTCKEGVKDIEAIFNSDNSNRQLKQ